MIRCAYAFSRIRIFCFFFSSRRRHTRCSRDWSSDVCSSDLHVDRDDEAEYFHYIMEIGDDEVSGQNIKPDAYSAKNLAKEIKRRGRIPIQECLPLFVSLTEALQFLHEQRLIHRDIKPSNIIYVN